MKDRKIYLNSKFFFLLDFRNYRNRTMGRFGECILILNLDLIFIFLVKIEDFFLFFFFKKRRYKKRNETHFLT